MYSDFLTVFQQNKTEVNAYFDFLRSANEVPVLGNNDTFLPKVNPVFQTLKGNAYLILYNLIEGTVSAAINEIFVSLNQDNLPFSDLTDTYKKLWLEYKAKCFEIAKNDKEKKKFKLGIEDLLPDLAHFKILPFYLKDGTMKEHYEAYFNTLAITDLSGNLDIRKLKELSEKYGFTPPQHEIFLFLNNGNPFVPIPCANAGIPFEKYLTNPFTYNILNGHNTTHNWVTLPDEEDIEKIHIAGHAFLKIKEKRNKLAHGNEAFSGAGQVGFSELYQMKEIVHDYLMEFVDNIGTFIANKGYKI